MPRFLRPVSVDPVPTKDQLADVRRVLDSPDDVLLPMPASDPVRASSILTAADPDVALAPVEDDADDPTVLAVATSGSSGAPQVVLLPESSLVASAAATAERLGGPGQWLLALGIEHIAGIQVVLRSLRAGHPPITCPPGGADFAARFVRATGKLTAERRYLSLVPTQLRRLLDGSENAAAQALSSFDAILLGGAAADQELLARAADVGATVLPTYGMTETAGGCVYAGIPLTGVEVHVEGDVGPITLTGPVVARGYRHATRLADNPFSSGSFRTSDAGHLRDGVLTVIGRTDDLINTGGHKVAPDEVAAALLAVPGVYDVAVVGLPDPSWGQVVAATVVAELTPHQLREAVRSTLPAYAIPRLIRRVRAVPRIGIGKVDRVAVTELLTAPPPG